MEALVSGCVGALCAVSADLLLDSVVESEIAAWISALRETCIRIREAMLSEVLHLEKIASEHGIASPRLRARQARTERLLPEAFGTLAISLGSGLSLTQAIRYVGVHAEEPIRSEFLRAASEMDCGVSALRALGGLVERMQAPGLELVALALNVSRRTGAPLAGLLAEAAQLASDRVELSRKLDVKTSQARMSARLVSCMPVGMIAFLTLLSGDFRAGIATVTGMASIVTALVLNVIAGVIIHRIMQVRL